MKTRHTQLQKGFTIYELLIVIAIMAGFYTLILANYEGSQAYRDLASARNVLATSIKSVQSNVFASSATTDKSDARYYVVEFTDCTGTTLCSYKIRKIYWDETNQKEAVKELQTVNITEGVVMGGSSKTSTTSGFALTQYTQDTVDPSKVTATTTSVKKVQLIYKLPFGSVYINTDKTGDPTDPVETIVSKPSQLLKLANRKVRIQLVSTQLGGETAILEVSGVSGTIRKIDP